MVNRLGAPVRMVPRRVLLERLLNGFPADRVRCGSRAVGIVTTPSGVRVEFEDGNSYEGDLLIGADGLHSTVRGVVSTQDAEPTGWASWQGLVTLPEVTDKHVAWIVIGENGNTGMWPAGDSNLQWWFDLPWSRDFVRPQRPLEVLRSNFTGWSDTVDQVLATLTDEDLTHSPYPAFSASDSACAGQRCADVTWRCRAHHAAHARARNQSGAARHDGAVQGTFGFPPPGQRQQR